MLGFCQVWQSELLEALAAVDSHVQDNQHLISCLCHQFKSSAEAHINVSGTRAAWTCSCEYSKRPVHRTHCTAQPGGEEDRTTAELAKLQPCKLTVEFVSTRSEGEYLAEQDLHDCLSSYLSPDSIRYRP